MDMEFVKVTCGNQKRPVFVDNQNQGTTDTRLSIPEGEHVFDLGEPHDYDPPFIETAVENTSSTAPMEIPFTLITVARALKRARAATRVLIAARTRAARQSTREGKPATARKTSAKKKTAKKKATTKKRTGGKKAAKGARKKR
jgi:hypothetical protein